MSKVFYNAKNLTIGNGFVRNPDRYYLEEFFEELPRVQYQNITSLTTEGSADGQLNTSTNSTSFEKIAEVNIPGNSLLVGDVIHIRGFALVTSSNGTDTSLAVLTFGPAVNGFDQIIGRGPEVDVSDNDIVHVDYYLTVRTIGSSGRIVGHGIITVGVSSLTTKNVSYSGTINYNTTQELYIRLYNQWSNAHADNIITAKSFVVEIKRLEIPNNNFVLECPGTNDGATVVFAGTPIGGNPPTDEEDTGIDIIPNARKTNIVISPNTNTNQSPWHNVKWNTRDQIEWECSLSLNNVKDAVVWCGLKLSITRFPVTDNDQIYFRYNGNDIENFKWKIIFSINGIDYMSNVPIKVKAYENYKLRISIDKYRFARVYINDVQYNISDIEGLDPGTDVIEGIIPSLQLADNVNLIPYIGIRDNRDTSAGDSKKLRVYYQKISKALF